MDDEDKFSKPSYLEHTVETYSGNMVKTELEKPEKKGVSYYFNKVHDGMCYCIRFVFNLKK